MARKRRRRKKFSPFRMSQRFQKSIIVALGVFLIAIFAVPFRGACRRFGSGERDPRAVAARIGERTITIGELDDVRLRFQRTFRNPLTEGQALLRMAQVYEAERAGIRVSDEEVKDAIRNVIFPRNVRIEYVIAENRAFEEEGSVTPEEVEAFYRKHRDTHFRRRDRSYRPFGEVREAIARELRAKKAGAKARQALVELKKKVEAIIGREAEGAFQRFALESNLIPNETPLFTARTALGALSHILEAPGIFERVFTQPIGKPSEPLPLTGGYCIFRVVARTRGFGPDGGFHPESEGWVDEGYGTLNVKSYEKVLNERMLTEPDLWKTVREDIALTVPWLVLRDSARTLPGDTIRDRFRRNNTRAVVAYFAMRTSDFTGAVRPTDDELRTFYNQRKNFPRTPQRVGYLQPPRVRIQYVLGQKNVIAQALSEGALRAFYERNRTDFKGSFEQARREVRDRLAALELMTITSRIAGLATAEADRDKSPDLVVLAGQAARQSGGAFECRTTPFFSAGEAETVVPELRGGKLANALFGEEGRRYVLPGAKRKSGTRVISPPLECKAGRFFFRVLDRRRSAEVPYENINKATREQLIEDLCRHKGFGQAQEKAREYRTKILKAAFERFAQQVAAKPVQSEFLKPGSPIASLGRPVPAIYDPLALAEPGELSDVVKVGERFVLARLAESDVAKGLRLELVAFGPDDLKSPYEPSTFEVRACYEDDPYPYLDPPEPIPFRKVADEIRKVLTRRRALAIATERVNGALADLLASKKPDPPTIAAKHKLVVYPDVKADLARTETTPYIGKAAGFRDAVTAPALRPGEVSRPLASAQGRFLFVLKKRDAKSATIDVAAAVYDKIARKVKLDEKEVRQYYDAHRETAYVTKDEIKAAPRWQDLPSRVRDRARKRLRDQWAKKPLLARLSQLRDSLVLEAFRTFPASSPLTISRQLKPTVLTMDPFPLSKPQGLFRRRPELLKAVRSLKVGEVSPPLEMEGGVLLAFVAERKPKDIITLDLATISFWDVTIRDEEPDDAELRKHYEANKDRFREPDRLQVRYLAVNYAELEKRLTVTEEELRKDYKRRVANGEFQDFKKLPDRVFLPFEKVKDQVRHSLLNRKARAQADKLLAQANKTLGKQGAKADFKKVAAKLAPLQAGVSSPFTREEKWPVKPVGVALQLAKRAFAAKEAELVGPIRGADGACLLRREKLRKGPVRPFDKVRHEIEDDLVKQRTTERARAAAAKLRERVVAALKQAKDRREAFRAAVEAEPLNIELSAPVRVTLSRPVYPLFAGRGKPSVITGLGAMPKPGLLQAIFRLRPARLTPVVGDPDRSACYVALLTRLLRPGKMSERDLVETISILGQMTLGPRGIIEFSWSEYLRTRFGKVR